MSTATRTEAASVRWDGGLLAAAEADPVGHEGAGRGGDVLVICDHAGALIPAALNGLGVPLAALRRHLAYDIGALGVARTLAEAVSAELLFQRYSRLVIDCNRPPHVRDAFVTRVDGVDVPGNVALDPLDAARRVAEIFHPYQARIGAAIASRTARGEPPVLVSVHSFTPHHGDRPAPRPWDVSVLFNRDSRLGLALHRVLAADRALTVGVNEPYKVDDRGDYAIPVHAERNGLLHVELEIRQDRIAAANEQMAWGLRLAVAIGEARAALAGEGEEA